MDLSKLVLSLRGPQHDPQKDQVIENLLREIWGFGSPQSVPRAKAASCFYHYENLLSNRQLVDDQNINLREANSPSSDVIGLVKLLKQNAHSTIADVRAVIEAQAPDWLLTPTSQEILDRVLHFAVRLWLFTRPDLSDDKVTLQDAIRRPLEKTKATNNNWLWLDFSEKTLRERGRFQIAFTSDISEHLTFASRSTIRVFSHASIIEQYEVTMEGKVYPPGLLSELRRTLNLLWPIEDTVTANYVYRLEEREEVDIESGMGFDEKFDLRLYPFFGERLAKIQERLESEEQRRTNSFGFRIAIWGIVLTALFGLVSAITGIMQVWASFTAL